MKKKKNKQPFISYRWQTALVCYGFVAIPVALLFLFTYGPVTWAFFRSLFEFEIGGDSKFVGFSHYIEYLTSDPTTWPSMLVMAIFTFLGICIQLTMPLIVAKLIYSVHSERCRHYYRILFLIPIVVPGVAVQLIWAGLIYSNQGIINEVLTMIGASGLTRSWLADPSTALLAIVFIGFPWIGGFQVLIYYAGLSNIPESVNEAALIEGCVGIKKFFLIDIPMVLSQLKLILVLTVITGVQGFENLLILTRGGPGYKTTVPGLMMYFNAFSFQRFGYACAIGVVIFVIIFSLTLLNFKYFKSAEDVQAVK